MKNETRKSYVDNFRKELREIMKDVFNGFPEKREILNWIFDKPAVSHDKPGAADYNSVDWDVLFNPIRSILGLSPSCCIL